MYPHRIRLLGPWECEPLAHDGPTVNDPLPAPCRMTMPCRWGEGGLGKFSGRVRFLRRFGYPGRIDAYERVWLTFAGVEGTAEVWLNDHYLGRHEDASPFEWEVTSLLQASSRLRVEIEASGGQGGLWGEVALEIRCTAYLRGLNVWAEPLTPPLRRLQLSETAKPQAAQGRGEGVRLHVGGEVVGTADRPLELYVLLDNATVAYTTVEAVPEGRPFHLVADRPAREVSQPDLHLVRVDLVNVASVWYVFEQVVDFTAPGERHRASGGSDTSPKR